ncbi:MAG: HDIG domain-containing protein [Puniceicoccales bacterium]|jgi:putative nucleotidyltransferase with HDIG domain|nr:HDIG domain-containing protein [Puniceicoccales bacterium]
MNFFIQWISKLFHIFRRKKGSIAAPAVREEGLIGRELHIARLAIIAFPIAAAIAVICFSGKPSLRIHIVPGQVLDTPIHAEIAFQYESAVQTNRLRERKGQRIAPIYKVDLNRFNLFREQITLFAEELESFNVKLSEKPTDSKARMSAIISFSKDINQRYTFRVDPKDISTILANSNAQKRTYYWGEGMEILNSIMELGVIDSSMQLQSSSSMNYFMDVDVAGRNGQQKLKTQEEALLYLRIHLGALEEERNGTNSLFHILSQGIHPNLTYDREKTEEKRAFAGSLVTPVLVAVDVGDVLINAHTHITSVDYEKLQAYRYELRKQCRHIWGIDHDIFRHFILAFAIIFSFVTAFSLVLIYRRGRQNSQMHGGAIAFFIAFWLLNLLSLRFLSDFWEAPYFLRLPTLFQILPLLTPIFVGTILTTLLLGLLEGMSYGLLLSIFFVFMIEKSSDFFIMLTGIIILIAALCRNISHKMQILRVGVISGLCLGTSSLFLTIFTNSDLSVAIVQFFGALVSGVMNGLLALLLLSPCEKIFRLMSNVRLQELSDFNHKLLRQLQIYAPGTYHHSLIVAIIAEQAAKAVGANALLCRVAALFHDVGKITKPEYFIENQTSHNPHTEKSPRISTLIIKNHVREGMKISQDAGIPWGVIQVIGQHHGTTLIQYFYNKARQQQSGRCGADGEWGGDGSPADVEESLYRYGGPRPQSMEAAILMFVDSSEAASRTLQKATQQGIETLVGSIFKCKIEDGQLEECPITYQQLHLIQRSIVSALTNMLHARISYAFNGSEEDESAAKEV